MTDRTPKYKKPDIYMPIADIINRLAYDSICDEEAIKEIENLFNKREQYHAQEMQRVRGAVLSEEEIAKILKYYNDHLFYDLKNPIENIEIAKAIHKAQEESMENTTKDEGEG